MGDYIAYTNTYFSDKWSVFGSNSSSAFGSMSYEDSERYDDWWDQVRQGLTPEQRYNLQQYGNINGSTNTGDLNPGVVIKGSGDTKTIDFKNYQETIDKSVHNPESNKVMLGKYDGGGSSSYITKAGDDYSYFDLGKDWDAIKRAQGLTDRDMFDLYNKSFLDDAMSAKKTFISLMIQFLIMDF